MTRGEAPEEDARADPRAPGMRASETGRSEAPPEAVASDALTIVISTTAEALEADALPRAHAVRTDPEAHGAEDEPIPRMPRARSPAEWAYRRLVLYIARFEDTLDAAHEVAMGFTDGGMGLLRIEGMGYFDPDIVTFYGSDPSGSKVQLIQHVTQLSVLLRALPKRRAEAEPRRIGFQLRADIEGEARQDEEGADARPDAARRADPADDAAARGGEPRVEPA